MFNRYSKNNRPRAMIADFESLEPRRLMAGMVSGTVFNDANLDGVQQSTEKGIAKQQVFIDLNFDGRQEFNEPVSITNSKGEYGFAGVGAGIYRIAVALPAGYRQISSGLGYYDVAVSGFGDVHTGNNFAVSTTGVLKGAVFNDVNHDGVRQITEFGVANVTVFLDKNGNGRYDKGEKRIKTDGVGNWTFNGLSAGKYNVRGAVSKGNVLTFGQSSVQKITLKSGQVISGRAWGLQ